MPKDSKKQSAMLPSSFFIATADGYEPTGLCRGPWHEKFQHAGPPSALIGRAFEQLLSANHPGFQVARVHINLSKPVPLACLQTQCRATRVGRQVIQLQCDLNLGDGTTLCSASALCIRKADLALPSSPPIVVDSPKSPADSEATQFNFFTHAVGYHVGMELRAARGQFGDGDVVVWMRMRAPLVAKQSGTEEVFEKPSPLQRTLIAADSGNGVSQRYNLNEVTFVNPDLDVALYRPAEGEWIALESITWPNSAGVGLADTRLWDATGPIGRGTQTLLLDMPEKQ